MYYLSVAHNDETESFRWLTSFKVNPPKRRVALLGDIVVLDCCSTNDVSVPTDQLTAEVTLEGTSCQEASVTDDFHVVRDIDLVYF